MHCPNTRSKPASGPAHKFLCSHLPLTNWTAWDGWTQMTGKVRSSFMGSPVWAGGAKRSEGNELKTNSVFSHSLTLQQSPRFIVRWRKMITAQWKVSLQEKPSQKPLISIPGSFAITACTRRHSKFIIITDHSSHEIWTVRALRQHVRIPLGMWMDYVRILFCSVDLKRAKV